MENDKMTWGPNDDKAYLLWMCSQAMDDVDIVNKIVDGIMDDWYNGEQ